MPLTHEQFETGAENVGATVVRFDQTESFGTRAYMGRGGRRAISTVWLRNQKLLQSGTPRPNQDIQLEEISWLAEQQHKGKSWENTEIFLRSHALRPEGIFWFKNGVNWEKLWFFLCAKPGYYLVGFDDPGEGSGHEIAFCTVNALKMFDPNFGAATFPDSQSMKRLFFAYWPKAYPELAQSPASIFRYV
ncbi:MAG: hypothetical protein QOF63_1920 [Thermoanaerobaculia bacterium]|jgi:hypothetical protein|nr:hypothetical protein [Thermoanaerobaculia bacterium]